MKLPTPLKALIVVSSVALGAFLYGSLTVWQLRHCGLFAELAEATRQPRVRLLPPPEARLCVVDRSVLDSRLDSISKGVRITPSSHDGHVDGFRLFAIRPGSFFDVLGFQNGDVVQRINGIDMTAPDKALETYTRLRAATELRIDLMRRGQPMRMDCHIL